MDPHGRLDGSRHRWLVTGGSGLLGTALCWHLVTGGARTTALRHEHGPLAPVNDLVVDLGGDFDADDLLDESEATVVLHAAAITDIDHCEADEDLARRVNVDATAALAGAAAARDVRFVFVSTDQLWASAAGPISEDVVPSPVNVYGETKAAAERATLALCPRGLVIRTNFFGPSTPWRRSSMDLVIDAVSGGGTFNGFDDVWYTPIGLPLLCRMLSTLACGDAGGVVHVAGADRVSKFEFARRIALHAGLAVERVVPISVAAADLTAPRPSEMALDCGRAERLLGTQMPSLAESIAAVYEPGGAR